MERDESTTNIIAKQILLRTLLLNYIQGGINGEEKN